VIYKCQISVHTVNAPNQQGGRDGSVGIATAYRLDGFGFEPWWGRDFSVPFQTGPGAHPVSCKIGTGSVPRGKAAGA
jgi:hypothetical protein